jgi:hypothetical protein
MNIKKILVLSIFAIAIIGIIAPINAALNGYVEMESTPYISGKLCLSIDSNIGMKDKNPYTLKCVSERQKEINTVKKVIITIKGYKPITIKKPTKGWVNLKYFSVKGNTNNKDYSMKLYDKNNKLLKNIKGKLIWTHNCID